MLSKWFYLLITIVVIFGVGFGAMAWATHKNNSSSNTQTIIFSESEWFNQDINPFQLTPGSYESHYITQHDNKRFYFKWDEQTLTITTDINTTKGQVHSDLLRNKVEWANLVYLLSGSDITGIVKDEL